MTIPDYAMHEYRKSRDRLRVKQHQLWRGEAEAQDALYAYLVTNQGKEVEPHQIAIVVEIIYPIIAGGVLSKAMELLQHAGHRAQWRDAYELLDLVRRRWRSGISSRDRSY